MNGLQKGLSHATNYANMEDVHIYSVYIKEEEKEEVEEKKKRYWHQSKSSVS